MTTKVAIVGVFVADLAFSAARLPQIGESFKGSSYSVGPGGKGSNQAVAAALAGAEVDFITKLGNDSFAQMARDKWAEVRIGDRSETVDMQTGAAMIFIDDNSGSNAIILVAGSGDELGEADVDKHAQVIKNADVVMTQLEQPEATALHTLRLAKKARVLTVFNPAPAPAPIDPCFFPLCDYITPNESETEGLTGIKVDTLEQADVAAACLLEKGVANVLLTLGERGVLLANSAGSQHLPAFDAGKATDTTGAGDSFNGALAAALAEGQAPASATRFATAAAAICVTRRGTSPAMPTRVEIEQVLASGKELKMAS